MQFSRPQNRSFASYMKPVGCRFCTPTVSYSIYLQVKYYLYFFSPVCRRKWICDHGAVSGINEKCPASINILIKKMNKQNTLKDAFLRRNPPHPAVIRINPNHNHPLMVPVATCKMYKVNNDVSYLLYILLFISMSFTNVV